MPKKRHIEYERHLGFLRKKYSIKVRYLDNLKQKKIFDKKDGL
jgi:hypothetical protein